MIVRVETGDAGYGEAAFLMLGMIAVRCPDANDRNPPDWWHIETVTGIAAERIARAWRGDRNQPLEDTIAYMSYEVGEFADNQFANIDELRREVSRRRLARGVTPMIFIGRTELLVPRVRTLLEDVLGSVLFTATDKKQRVPAIIQYDDEGRAQMHLINDQPRANGLFLRWMRPAKPGKVPKGVDPATTRVPPAPAVIPPIVVTDFYTYPPAWPKLNGVNRLPSVRADGTISDFIGYDPITKMWNEPEPSLRNIHISERPTAEEISLARAALIQPIAELPLIDGYAGPLAVVFERLTMAYLTGPRPAYVIDAPEFGQASGKSLCARTVSAIILGREPAMDSWPKSDETEVEKRIMGLLSEGVEIAWFDNIVDPLDSDSVTRMVTSTVWRGRILGKTGSPEFPNLLTPLFTFNNSRYSDDLIRRVCLIRLDKRLWSEKQRRGEFAIDDVVQWVIHYRAHLITAALTIVKAWVQAGFPKDPRLVGHPACRGFQRWMHVIGGILHFAGIDGLPQSFDAAAQRGKLVDDDFEFASVWWSTYGANAVTTSDLLQLALANGLYRETLCEPDGKPAKGSWGERKLKKDVLERLVYAERVGSGKPAVWRIAGQKA